jgi:hypothetical protein
LYSENNFQSYQDLELPICADLVTSATVFDATFSGYNSIALGTFGKMVFILSPTSIKPIEESNNTNIDSEEVTNKNNENIQDKELANLFDDLEVYAATPQSHKQQQRNDKKISDEIKQITSIQNLKYQFNYEIKREIYFKHSILGLDVCDLSNQGVFDLVILSLNGISVWQYDQEKLIDYLNKEFEKNENTRF